LSIKPRTRHGSRLIDVVLDNAGYASVGPLEDSSMDEIKAQYA